MNTQSEYEVKDLYLAAYLFASGLPLVRTERKGKFTYFIFPRSDKSDSLTADFWSYKGTIVAKSYIDATQSLKDIIFAD